MTNVLFCFVGPSGSGKTTLIDKLENTYSFLHQVRSYTTRKKRTPTENNHTFITAQEFKNLKNLIAYTKFDNEEYGVTKEQLDNTNLYAIDIDGLIYLKEKYKDKKIVTVGLCCDENKRKQRMFKRGQNKKSVYKRLNTDKKAFKNYLMYCNIILNANNNLEDVFNEFIRKASYFDARFKHEY